MNTMIEKMMKNIEIRVDLYKHDIVSNIPLNQHAQYYELYIMPRLDFVTITTIRMWVSRNNDHVRFQIVNGDQVNSAITINYNEPGHAWLEFIAQLTECMDS